MIKFRSAKEMRINEWIGQAINTYSIGRTQPSSPDPTKPGEPGLSEIDGREMI